MAGSFWIAYIYIYKQQPEPKQNDDGVDYDYGFIVTKHCIAFNTDDASLPQIIN